jgi:type IV pilus assembly protein PilN
MIRINLLPEELRKRRKTVSFRDLGMLLHGGIALVILIGVVVGVVFQVQQMNRIRNKLTELEQEKVMLAPQVVAVRKIKTEQQRLERHLQIISHLDTNRFFHVRLVDEFAETIPEGLWISSLSEPEPGKISVDGKAYSSLLIADFVARLERSDFFSNAELVVAEEKHINETRVVEFVAVFNFKNL